MSSHEKAALVAAAALGGLLVLAARRRAAPSLSGMIVEQYDLSPLAGFRTDAATSLPPRYAPWEKIAARLATLNRRGTLRAAIEGMPVLQIDGLNPPELRRARVILGCLVHSFVHGHLVPLSLIHI